MRAGRSTATDRSSTPLRDLPRGQRRRAQREHEIAVAHAQAHRLAIFHTASEDLLGDTGEGDDSQFRPADLLIGEIREAVGSLDRVKRVVKVIGFVNVGIEFGAHPTVINGASDLLQQLFGEAGRHARSAVGLSSLPSNVSVEVELVVEVR